MAANVVTVVGCMVVVLGFIAAFWRDLKGSNTDLRTEINGVRGDLTTEINGLRGDLTTEVNGLRGDLTTEINGLRGDLTTEINGVRGEVHQLGERVARIEGRLDERDGVTK